MKRIRVGIDVGGTFTHAVAVDNDSLEVLAHAVTPTTHTARESVARGIIDAFQKLQEKIPEDSKIVFLAHSTTQATNALLEGDVASVAVVGLGSGLEAVKAKADMTLGPLELAPGKFLNSRLEFMDNRDSAETIQKNLQPVVKEGVGALVAAEAFSVDDPSGERRVMDAAATLGVPACGTHEMSGLYGLRVRTRTAVINASILPKMIQTAEMTGSSLRSLKVDAALMIMRSDGGVMSLEEVRRRPVMTLLSGPAAGIAAALMFLRASDALFLEVGGTSTDICLIKNGRAAVKSAQLGGHPTYLRTLDSRTLGIAGGSMLGKRVPANGSPKSIEVGPRSAHLAGLKYSAFADPAMLEGPLKVVEVTPFPSDPPYYAVENEKGERVAVTTTCAANLLGYIKPGDYAAGNVDNARKAIQAVAAQIDMTAEDLARGMLERMAGKIMPTLKQLLEDYDMKDRAIKLIGGGGGASAVVAFVAEKMGLPFEIAPRAEVISAIGAALAMVKETVERNILNPTQADITQLRAEAEKAVIKMGADPATIEVTVEVDGQKNVVRATATGSVEFVAQDILQQDVGEDDRLRTLKEASPREESYALLGSTDFLHVYQSQRTEKALFNLIKRTRTTVWITDGRGNVKLQVPGGIVQESRGEDTFKTLEAVIAKYTSYGDAGARVPPLHVIAGRKMVDLSALNAAEQMTTLAREELSTVAKEERVFFVVHPS